MDNNLKKLLINGNNEDGDNWTHISVFPYPQRWNLKTNYITTFWENYVKLVKNGKGGLCIRERINGGKSPFTVTTTFKFHRDDECKFENIFTSKFLVLFVYCFQFAVYDQMVIRESEKALITAVLMTPPTQKGEEVIISLKLQFPYCRTDMSVQKKRLIPEAIKKLRLEKVIQSLEVEPISNDWSTIIDTDTITDSMLIYGSSDSADMPAHNLDYIFRLITQEDLSMSNDDSSYAPTMEFDEAFNLGSHSEVANGTIDVMGFPDEEHEPDALIPLYLSANYDVNITKPKENMNTPKIKIMIKSDTNEVFDMANLFLGMIDVKNIDKNLTLRAYWEDVGRVLYYVSDSDRRRGYILWMDYTKTLPELLGTERCEGVDIPKHTECSRLYHTYNKSRLTEKTLAWYAKESNFNEYNKWHLNRTNKYMLKALDCTHVDVATCLYELYWLELAYDGDWFFFDKRKNRWTRDIGEVRTHELLRKDFNNKLEAFRTNCSQKIQETKNEDEKNKLELHMKKCMNLITKMKDTKFKNPLVGEMKRHFQKISEFNLKLDENPHFMGMSNCIIDTSGKSKVMTRNGKPEDFVSMCTNVEYPFDYDYDNAHLSIELKQKYDIEDDEYINPDEIDYKLDENYDNVHEMLNGLKPKGWKHKNTRRLMKWLGQVFGTPDLLHFFLKDASSFLRGRNSEKLLRVFSGGKDASKSMIIKLFNCFNVYKINMPVSFMGGKSTSSSNATPELARTKGTHMGIMSEPDEDQDKLTAGKVKRFVCGDAFFARFLNQNGGDIEMMCKLILMCNQIPEIVGLANDEASVAKLLILPFLSLWSLNAPDNIQEQYKKRIFKMDPYFEDSIPELYSSFMWVLVQYFPTYLKEGLSPPETVTKYTQDYVDRCDPYHQFQKQMIVKTFTDETKTIIDESRKLTQKVLYDAYKLWLQDNNPGSKKPNIEIAMREFERRLGKRNGAAWLGMVLVEQATGKV
jgi:phage/plasmid-associated DNA primase